MLLQQQQSAAAEHNHCCAAGNSHYAPSGINRHRAAGIDHHALMPVPFRPAAALRGSQPAAAAACYSRLMSYISPAELAEIVPDLRALAAVETSDEVRAALLRLAERYAAMAADVPHELMAA
jgi:hypothetical protein